MIGLIRALMGGAGGGLGFVLLHWRSVLGVLLIVGVVLVVSALVVERNAARQEVVRQAQAIATQQEQIKRLRQSMEQLQVAIEQQNVAVQRVAESSAQRQQAASVALEQALQASGALRAEIAGLKAKNQTAAAVKEKSCEDALREWRAGR
ncbi:hypothetical protein ACM714_27555 [Pseudomonas aeruginosa]|nr:hypothetical protein [Pseudomonas aeruginosa]HCL3292892.1 hypothetical protein [Pseudomonas aeruginosa]